MMLDCKVIHMLKIVFNFFLIIFIFQCFLFKTIFANHLNISFSDNIKFDKPIIIEAFDRKLYFEEKKLPLFTIKNFLTENIRTISLDAFPHTYIGLLAFQDINEDGELTLNYKGDPMEPYGFSLNPSRQFKEVKFEDIVFDMSNSENFLIIELRSIFN